MSEMIERVARAISPKVPICCGAVCVFTPLTECICGQIAALATAAMRELPNSGMVARCVSAASASGLDCQDWTYAALEELVRIIIKEMREPTEEMLRSASPMGVEDWRVMIDTALAD